MKINDSGHKTPTKPLKTPDTFKEKDINKDGVLTGTELKGAKKFDGDANKTISKDEFLAGRKKENMEARTEAREKALDKLDVNNDGILTGTEKAKMKKWDTDGDGDIDQKEFDAGKSKQWKAKVDAKFDDLFDKLDKTGENVLTGAESKKHKDWDADGDGQITKDEAKAGYMADRKSAAEKAILNGEKKEAKPEKDKVENQPDRPRNRGLDTM